MQIQEVSLTVTGLAAAARFYRDVLELPVTEQPGQAMVTIGSSRLVLEEGDQFAGAHHLALGMNSDGTCLSILTSPTAGWVGVWVCSRMAASLR